MKHKKVKLPQSLEELNNLSYERKADLWKRFVPYPYKRQTRALWYYIQCENHGLKIEQKHMTKIRKYMNNPELSSQNIFKNKYKLNPGVLITKTFRGLEFKVLIGNNNEFIYKDKTYKTLSAIAKEICGKKVSGPDFFGLDNKRIKHLTSDQNRA